MIYRSYIVFLFLLGFVCASAQSDPSYSLIRTVPGTIADFMVDNLGNIYLLSGDNQLKKIDVRGDSVAVFNDVRRYGKLFSVDVANPLKILLYYREFATIVVVDRFLNIRTTIDLRKQNILQAKAVGLAYDNNIWVYDELEAKLKKLGDDGSVLDQTNDFRQSFDTVPDPSVIVDQAGLVYLYDVEKGVYAFDHYGGFRSHVPLKNWQDFTVIDKVILGRDGGKFYRYQLGTLDLQEEPVPAVFRDALKIRITPGAIYILRQKGLEIYSHR